MVPDGTQMGVPACVLEMVCVCVCVCVRVRVCLHQDALAAGGGSQTAVLDDVMQGELQNESRCQRKKILPSSFVKGHSLSICHAEFIQAKIYVTRFYAVENDPLFTSLPLFFSKLNCVPLSLLFLLRQKELNSATLSSALTNI